MTKTDAVSSDAVSTDAVSTDAASADSIGNGVVRLDELTLDSATDLHGGGSGGWDWVPGGPYEGSRFVAGRIAAAITEGRHTPGWAAYTIVRVEDGRAIGGIGFHGPPVEGRAEIGYDLAEAARGKGYATEAVRALCAWAFAQEGVRVVFATTDVPNTASQNVLKRAGFRQVGGAGPVGDREDQYLFELPAP
ncbi:GNAT family N-acetyltransferase [Streptomyces sp. NPDC050504]|uniref:GNAT family N-acetyltransferase n=1 Tax=Streptomyces sp. NPDC050504 TaxID=3365618 RepID=UPI00379227C4